MLYIKEYALTKIVNECIDFIAEFTSVVKPNRVFARKPNHCKHPVGYKRNLLLGAA